MLPTTAVGIQRDGGRLGRVRSGPYVGTGYLGELVARACASGLSSEENGECQEVSSQEWLLIDSACISDWVKVSHGFCQVELDCLLLVIVGGVAGRWTCDELK